MAVGMARFTAPSKSLTTEDTEKDFLLALRLWFAAGAIPARVLSFSFFFNSALPRVLGGWLVLPFCLSNFAIASASHGAFTAPRDAGRLLVHFAEPWSPAMSAMLRPVSADSSYLSMS